VAAVRVALTIASSGLSPHMSVSVSHSSAAVPAVARLEQRLCRDHGEPQGHTSR
jgi:hypothetical protein